MREITYREALREALIEEMKRDERVFILGEDVAIYGGAYKVTDGLYKMFGEDRVKDTPISEAAIAGLATGAALTGMRPIAEIMYIDFSTQATDQMVNQAAKMRYMFGGKSKVPMVLRTQGGAGRGIAAHHSQSLEAWYVHMPGLYVVMPATPYDAKGLLKSSIRDDNPIVFIEHKMLYGMKGEVPEEEYLIPLGKGEIKREGEDVTIIAYSRMLHVALEAAEALEKEGVSCEVIDPRTLKPLDMDLIADSVRKTNKAVVVSEGYRYCGMAAEIVTRIIEECFDDLDAPVKRITTPDVPIPMSPVLEEEAIPSAKKVIQAVQEIL
ncbi:MAG: alpha-ketoacid dehydrogenase subunit beta [Caldiserica bacterium]|nr:alpha-ketoacid dehydrogenase subunit beta [Caldisericota bacterium]